MYRVEKRKNIMWVPIFCVEGSRKCISLYQGYQKCHFLVLGSRKCIYVYEGLKITNFWYWGSRKCIFVYEGLKINNIWYWEYRKSNFLVYGGVTKIRKMSYPSPHLNNKVRFVCNVTLSYFTLVQL